MEITIQKTIMRTIGQVLVGKFFVTTTFAPITVGPEFELETAPCVPKWLTLQVLKRSSVV